MSGKVRVRFAPSPTGPLHIGGVRTALFNYLFSKKHDGDFILRIEDTDQNRYVPGSEHYILDALEWCGLIFDEGPHKGGKYGPYRQSERKDLYREYAETLIKTGHAYYAFDSPESLASKRDEAEKAGSAFSYNWANRGELYNSLQMTGEEVAHELNSGRDYVVRFKSPKDEILKLHDTIRGHIEIDTNTLDDKVLFKSDGMPTYHLANIVDDHLMKITHVIRGEEWLPSLALHYQLYNAFGWETPEFAHLPLIMKPEGKGKLSKRDGEKLGFPVYPLRWEGAEGYRESGYFPEAVINFLALLGWNPGTEQEVFTLEELVSAFSLERVHKSGARFDPDKTKWYNHQYLQKKTPAELALLFRPELESRLPVEVCNTIDLGFIEKSVALLQERATFVSDFWDMGSYFYLPPTNFNPKVVKKQWKEGTPAILQEISELLKATRDFSSSNLEKVVKKHIEESESLGFGNVMAPLRLALVGDLMGPHLFDILELLGKEASLKRIAYAIDTLSV